MSPGISPPLELEAVLRTLAHDLKNAVGTILMQTSSLRRLNGERALARLDESTRIVERAAQAIAELAEETNELGELAVGHVALDAEPVELAGVARRAVEIARPTVERHASTLVVEVEDGLPPMTCDGARVTEALARMIEAAAKTSSPTELIVEVGQRDEGERAPSLGGARGLAERSGARRVVHPEGAPEVRLSVRSASAAGGRRRGDRSLVPRHADPGLWIAGEIARAHGGRLDVPDASSEVLELALTLPARAHAPRSDESEQERRRSIRSRARGRA